MAQVQIIQPYQPQSDVLEKVAAYCRVSTDSKDQLNSYRTQIGYYTNFIAQHPGWELADIYADEGITGTSLEKRDEFKRMLADCRAGKISRILVKSVSRFARNTLELIETTRELKDLGVVVVFEEQGIDTAQMLGEMQLTLLAMAAQEESTSISKNMRWSYQKRMERGKYVTTKAPYGYAITDGKLTPNPEEAAVVQTIFRLFLEGKGQQQIAFLLNQTGIIPRESPKWGRTTIEHILSNERYIGDALVQKRFTTETLPHKQVINRGQIPQYYITDSHPALISREIFDQAQMLKATRAVSPIQSTHTFTHRIQCPSCGRYYRHINSSGTSRWACPNRVNKVKDCPNFWIPEKTIKAAFANMIGKLYSYHDSLLAESMKLLEEIAARQEQGNAKLYELNTALADLNEKAHTLQRLHNKGFIEDADFREQSDALASQRKKLSDQRTQAIHGSKALETLDKLRELQNLLASHQEIPWEFDIGLFDQLVEKIVPISKTELLFKLIGYQYENGALAINPPEAHIVQNVFSQYLLGEPLSKIASHLTAKLVEYLPGCWQWNKARVKRILDNAKYIGNGEYPSIIKEKDFQMAHQQKESANTNRQPVDEDIKLFKGLTHCHHCGNAMVRRMDSRMEHPVTWKCPACDYFLPLPDEEFKHRVFLLQQRLVAKPLLTEKEEEIPVTSMEARRLTNEIFRKLDSGSFSEEELVNLALQCAAKNYEAISSARHITERLTATLLHAGPLSAFDRTLFEKTVSEIHLARKGEILLKLQNGVFIGEGDAP